MRDIVPISRIETSNKPAAFMRGYPLPSRWEKGVGNMNIVSNSNTIPGTGYGYPIVVTETPDYAFAYREDRDACFQNSRFSRDFRFGRHVLDFEQETELYNSRKRMEPNAMQLIGTLINLYA